MSNQELIEFANKAIAELVFPKWDLQKAYNYYNGKMDADQYRYIEEQYGIGNPTSVKFIPLIRKHIDALVGEYLGSPIIPKVSCKDSETISKITREKELMINREVQSFLLRRLTNKLLSFFLTGQSLVDEGVKEALDQLLEDLNDSFISLYEIAAQNVLEYIMQARETDIYTKLRQLFLDLLITGYTFYRVSSTDNDILIEVLNPLNTFIDRNPESPYVKDSYRVVIRHWMTKNQILNRYGKRLSAEDKKVIDDNWRDAFSTSTFYVRSMPGTVTEGLQAGKEIVPGYPTGPTFNYKLIPVYDVEWTQTDNKGVMLRYTVVKIGESIYIPVGKDEHVIRRMSDPTRCGLSVGGIYFTNRGVDPYSLVLACVDLLDKYNLLHFYRDNLIASSGTAGDFIDISVLPKFLGADTPSRLAKFLSYKKAGIAPIDTSQEGRLGGGLTPINTIYNGFDDTIKIQTIQAIQLAIDSIEQTCSSITGIFRERLNGITQRDAVTNVLVSVNNSFTVTKQYYQQMDVLVEDLLLDSLDQAKIVFKNGLKGHIILGDKYQKIFTALPEFFTLSDYDIHIVTSADITMQLNQLKQLLPELVKAGLLSPELIVDAVMTKSLTDLRLRIVKAIKKQRKENNTISNLTQALELSKKEIEAITHELKSAQQKIEYLNESRILLEQAKLKLDTLLEWYKVKTDRTYKESRATNDSKRTEIELLQLHDGNPYNDLIVNEYP